MFPSMNMTYYECVVPKPKRNLIKKKLLCFVV